MPGGPNVIVRFLADTKALASGVSSAQTGMGKVTSGLSSMGKAGAVAAGAAGIGAVVTTLKIGIDEYAEAAKVGAQTNAVIKSTGGAAKVSADHVSDLATSLMKKSGMDDEAIQSGENLLLTFTNIQNRAGQGNDIFDQTTKAMADMAVAMGQDPKTAAMQLGKALNDPVKGMSKLSKVGVTFTDQQKAQAAAMMKAGDVAGAQKIILGELNKEFGGSAEAAGKTLPGMLNIARESFNNFAGEIVAKAIPYLQQFVAFIRKNWPQISAVFQQVWAILQPILAALIDLVVQVVDTIRANWGTIGPIVQGVAKLMQDAARILADALKLVTDLLRGDWDQAWKDAKKLVADVITEIGDEIKLGVAAITAAVQLVIDAIKKIISGGIDAVSTAAHDLGGKIKTFLASIPATISAAVSAVASAVKRIISEGINAVSTAAHDLGGKIKTFLEGIPKTIAAAVTGVGGALKKMITDGIDDVASAAHDLGDRIKSGLEAIPKKIANAVSDVASAIKSPINAVIDAWNGIRFHVPKFTIGGGSHLGVDIPKFTFGGQTIDFPDLPRLAKGGVLERPTVFLGGEAGREIVAPERLLREIVRAETSGRGDTYQLTIAAQRADAASVAYGFRRLELLRQGR